MKLSELDNKPKYNFFSNFSFAVDGLKDMLVNETSFRLDLIFFVIFSIISYLVPFSITYRLILFFSLFFPLFSEIINSALERLVDLFTTEYNIQAKRIKDIGASLVILSFFVTFLLWLIVFKINFKHIIHFLNEI